MAVLLQIRFFWDSTLCRWARSFLSFDNCCVFVFRVHCKIKKNLLNPEEEGNTVFRHVKRYSVKSSACHLKRLRSSEIQFLCPDSKEDIRLLVSDVCNFCLTDEKTLIKSFVLSSALSLNFSTDIED
jgi:hypothetical protein